MKLTKIFFIISMVAVGLFSKVYAKDNKREALIIANNNYAWDQPLKNPHNDAALIKDSLEKLGFNAVVEKDTNRRKMIKSIKAFKRRILDKRANIGVFYYAGHGVQNEEGDNDISYSELYAYVKSRSDSLEPQMIKNNGLDTSIFTEHHVTEPQAVAEQKLTNENSHNVQISWVNAQTEQSVSRLAYCPDSNDPSCQLYKIKATSDKAGWLLIYELSENGKLQKFFTNSIIEDNFPNQFTGKILANHSFVMPLASLMTDKTTNQLITIVLSPEEQSNYEDIAKQIAETRQADEGFIYTTINRRNRIIGTDGQLSPWSVATLKYQAK